MNIKLHFTTLDGIRKTKRFKTLRNARKAAQEWVGTDADIGSYYAVSADGVVRVTVTGCTLADLFGPELKPEKPTEKFMAIRKGSSYNLYSGAPCLANLFAVAYEAYDTATGDTYQGWTLKGIGYGYEDWMTGDMRYATLHTALAAAKAIYKSYQQYCDEEAAAEAYAEGAWLRAAEMGSAESQHEEDLERQREAAFGK